MLAGKVDGTLGTPRDFAEAGLADAEEGIASAHPAILVPVFDRGALPMLGRLLPDLRRRFEGGAYCQSPSGARRASTSRGARHSPPLASAAVAAASWIGVAEIPWPKEIVA